ncbi:MAG: histidinol-phosphate transaminase [Candidatus Margulisbacteria bacterium]|nr:histidinol-phosphate transaminase [Candidatus Margulisiibacteriota bacterium]
MEEFLRPAVKEIKDYVPGKNPTSPGVVKLASNENPFGPSPKALEAIEKEAKNLHIYPDQKSLLLREALAKKLAVETDNLIIGNGSDEIMQIAAATYLKPGEEVIVSAHTFSVYEFVTRLFDGQPVFAPLNNFEQDLDAMARAITPRTKIIFLCNPHNPTGTYCSNQELIAFLDKVPDNILVVIDEAYAEFAEAADFPKSADLIKSSKNLLVLRTFSKYYGLAGLRVGYGTGNKDLIHYMFRTKLPFNVNRLAQMGALAALDDNAFLDKTYKNNLEGKKYFYAEFDKLGLEHKKTEANFIFVNIKRSADEAFLALMKAGVIIRPLTSFGLPEAIRVSIGAPEQNRKFIANYT